VVGDSSAAGVGAPTQDLALLGRLIEALVVDGPVEWRLIARIGATAAGTRRHLAQLSPDSFDVALMSVGANDLMTGRSPSAVMTDIIEVAALLRNRFGVRHVLVTGMPPMRRFPAHPQPLRWYMGWRARTLDDAMRSWAVTAEGVDHLPLELAGDPVPLMAEDGFHPGPALYAIWAQAAAARVATYRRASLR
jgi:lysophospholipase L1-like esterase